MSFEELLVALEERPGPLGKGFERICKWYLLSAPDYRPLVRQVWLWDEWPGRWAADAGIDLVAETVGSDLWAVQAKHYDPAYAIKKTDIDSFLSESARPVFSYRLLIGTTDRIGKTARRTIAGQEKPAGVLLRSQLAVSEVDWPSLDELTPRAANRKTPRAHQREAVEAVVEGLRSVDRGQLIMACGTGKTLVGCFIASVLAARCVLVLVPSLSLLAQSLREWGTAAEFTYLAVCSDETVAPDAGDAIVASTSELGIPVTTDPATIARFLQSPHDAMRVVFATYQSAERVVEAQKSGSPFDLVIADEAHRCAGPEAGVFATVLDPSKIRATKRLFMTATPRVFSDPLRKRAREAGWEVASMDDPARFGKALHRLSFSEAVRRGLLSDYQVAVVGVSDATYRDYAERGVFVTPDQHRVIDARTLAGQLGLLRAMKNYDLRRVVTFHSRINSASAFALSLSSVWSWLPTDRRPDGNLWTDHVSGRMSSGERDSRLNRLRSVERDERGVLTNARCLSEGVDVPTLDGVVFIDPRRSQIDVIQAVGRAMRKADDKTIGTVVIPVFVDEHLDPELALESSEFSRVWEVVKALRAHDDLLADELDSLRRAMGRRSTPIELPTKIHFDLPIGVGDSFARAFDTRLVESTTSSWELGFAHLEAYAAREGHTRVHMAHKEDDFPLGRWVREQRNAHTNYPGRVTADRISRLEALPGWVWGSWHEHDWEENYRALERYVMREGHARVPVAHIESGLKLGRWALFQRRDYRKGFSRLTPDRKSRLEAVPGWSWGKAGNVIIGWEAHFALLLRFIEQEGHARVPADHLEGGQKLGLWVRNQRQYWARGQRWMTPERIARLDALPGWSWGPWRDRPSWDDYYSLLVRYVTREGHSRVPRLHVESEQKLGVWVANQRAYYRGGTRRLTPDQAKRLEALTGWFWSALDDAWEGGFSRLQTYVARHGHARVPQKYADESGYRLGLWVTNQRRHNAGRARSMTIDRRDRLEALPGWTWELRRRSRGNERQG